MGGCRSIRRLPRCARGCAMPTTKSRIDLVVIGSKETTTREQNDMSITRRKMLATTGAAVAASTIAKPAIAAKDPILIGYLPALTGPSSSTGIGINRGVQLAVDEINKAGGIDGRMIEIIQRDTQSDPTKIGRASC